jgi:ribosomal-protein-alanine N-acetyltransferase
MAEQPANNQVDIRPMQAKDLERVQAIDKISFSMPWSSRAYRYELNENPASSLWVAEASPAKEPKRLVGFIVVWLIGAPANEAHIATIAVHPEYRNRGIAKKLLRTALASAIQKGANSATLEVRAQNEIAQKLYRRFKFEVVGHRPRYYRDNNEDAVIMTVEALGPDYLAWLRSAGWPRQSDPIPEPGASRT